MIKLYEEIFHNLEHTGDGKSRPYILMECRVVEDFYDGKIEAGTVLNIPISVDRHISGDDYLTDEYRELLSGVSSFYGYLSYYNGSPRYKYSSADIFLETNVYPVTLYYYELLPVTDGRVYPDSLDHLLDPERGEPSNEDLVGMGEFCYSGIPCEEFEDNIRELSEYFDEREEKRIKAADEEQAKRELYKRVVEIALPTLAVVMVAVIVFVVYKAWQK